MNTTPTDTATDPAAPVLVFSTLLLMLMVLVAAIIEVGMAFLSVDTLPW
jgi:hypothetical protein